MKNGKKRTTTVRVKAPKKKRTVNASRRNGDVVLEFGDVKVRIKETTIRNTINDINNNPTLRDTVTAVKNAIRPADDKEMEEFLKKKKSEKKDDKEEEEK
jgi:hypothetical protein